MNAVKNLVNITPKMYIPIADSIVGDCKMCGRKEFIQLIATPTTYI